MGRLATLKARVSGVARHRAARTTCMLLAALIGGAVGWPYLSQWFLPAIRASVPPGEYLYIDNARVANYLSQSQGGEAYTTKESKRLTQALDFGVEGGGATAGGSAQAQDFVEHVLTPTASSNFMRLRSTLEKSQHLRQFHNGKLAYADYDQLREGDFVELSGVQLRIAGPGALYYSLKRTGAVLPEQGEIPVSSLKFTGRQRRVLNTWLATFGPNPRIIFRAELKADQGFDTRPGSEFLARLRRFKRVISPGAVSQATRDFEKSRGVKVLIPTQYKALADEESLSSGGASTVLGKVLRKYQFPPERDVVERFEFRYQDAQTKAALGRATERIPGFLIRAQKRAQNKLAREIDRRLGSRVRLEFRLTKKERAQIARHVRRTRISREQLGRELETQTVLDGPDPGMLIAPLAIYR